MPPPADATPRGLRGQPLFFRQGLDDDWVRQYRAQQEFIASHVLDADAGAGEARPSIRADAELPPWDAEILANIEARMRRHRFLEMQATFFNVTGRMLPSELIPSRIEEAEGAAGADGEAGEEEEEEDDDE